MQPSAPAPAPASYLSVVLPVTDVTEGAPVYVKLLVPLFSRAADLLLDRRRNWVWEVSDGGEGYDLSVHPEERNWLKNSFRYLADLTDSEYPVTDLPPEILYTLDFRSLPI